MRGSHPLIGHLGIASFSCNWHVDWQKATWRPIRRQTPVRCSSGIGAPEFRMGTGNTRSASVARQASSGRPQSQMTSLERPVLFRIRTESEVTLQFSLRVIYSQRCPPAQRRRVICCFARRVTGKGRRYKQKIGVSVVFSVVLAIW